MHCWFSCMEVLAEVRGCLMKDPAPVKKRLAATFVGRKLWPVLTVIAVCALAAAVVVAVTFHRTTAPIAVPSTPAATAPADPYIVTPTADLKVSLTQGLGLTAWPKVTNKNMIGAVMSFLKDCQVKTGTTDPGCIVGPDPDKNQGKIALAWGDSILLSHWPMIRDSLVADGWTVIGYGRQQCPLVLTPGLTEDSAPKEFSTCWNLMHSYDQILAKWKPNLVIMSGGEMVPTALGGVVADAQQDDPEFNQLGGDNYVNGVDALVAKAKRYSSHVVLLSAPPAVVANKAIDACWVAGSTPQACIYSPQKITSAVNGLNERIATNSGATYANMIDLFCVSGMCPAVVSNVVVNADFFHVTPEYSSMLAPSFQQWLVAKGIA